MINTTLPQSNTAPVCTTLGSGVWLAFRHIAGTSAPAVPPPAAGAHLLSVEFCRRGRHALLSSVDRLRTELVSAFSAQICGGVSAQGRRGIEVRRCYQEARTACLAARSGGGILFYNQVSLEFLARSIPPAIRKDLFRQVFGGCPQKEQEELLETVRLYFQCDGQVDRMARVLYVHKNTCHYRLQKLKEKTGYSVHNPRESVLLCLCSLFARLEEA